MSDAGTAISFSCQNPGVARSTEGLIEHARRLKELNSWFEIALNNMARGLSMFDANQCLVVCNSLYRDIYGLPEELTRPGTSFSALVGSYVSKAGGLTSQRSNDHEQWTATHLAELQHGKTFTRTQHLIDGRIILVTTQPLADGGWVDIQEDVTEKTRAAERITWLAKHCPLTEAANCFHLRERLGQAIAASTERAQVAVHVIDLDRFKLVNDTYGHAAGDALLKAVAKRMRSTVRNEDIVGRLGGDEFAVIQCGVATADQAESLAQRLIRVLSAPYRVLGASANIGASIGIAMAPQDGACADSLLNKADIALYRVKSSGRGNYSVYRSVDEVALEAQQSIEQDLKHAVQRNQLALHYQPIINFATRQVVGLEALMRWNHPRLGMLLPDQFISRAEKSGDIVPLGAWAMQQACKDAAEWGDALKVSVNVSYVEIDRSDLALTARLALEASGLAADRLEVEVTEAVLTSGETPVSSVLNSLRELGIRVAVDDFGAASASLGHLCKYSFDRIKLDGSLVREIAERRDYAAIVRAIAELARALEIETTAEGIETEEQLAKVVSAGCTEVQGFHLGRPVPAEEVLAMLARSKEELRRI